MAEEVYDYPDCTKCIYPSFNGGCPCGWSKNCAACIYLYINKDSDMCKNCNRMTTDCRHVKQCNERDLREKEKHDHADLVRRIISLGTTAKHAREACDTGKFKRSPANILTKGMVDSSIDSSDLMYSLATLCLSVHNKHIVSRFIKIITGMTIEEFVTECENNLTEREGK